MSAQGFSVVYRAPGIVDVLIPKVADVAGYRLKASPAFDGSPVFNALFTASPIVGYIDPSVDRRKLHVMPGRNRVRAVFNPQTFNTDAGISDTSQFWMRLVPVDSTNTEGDDGPPVLVMAPNQQQGTSRIVIAGAVASAASAADALQLCLGRRMTNAVLQNTGESPLLVAFSPGGGEIEIQEDESYRFKDGSFDCLYVRGSGGATRLTASFTVAPGID